MRLLLILGLGLAATGWAKAQDVRPATSGSRPIVHQFLESDITSRQQFLCDSMRAEDCIQILQRSMDRAARERSRLCGPLDDDIFECRWQRRSVGPQ